MAGAGAGLFPTDRPVAVYVTVFDKPLGEVDATERGQGARMAGALERLAGRLISLADINDAAIWNTRRVRSELCQVKA